MHANEKWALWSPIKDESNVLSVVYSIKGASLGSSLIGKQIVTSLDSIPRVLF